MHHKWQGLFCTIVLAIIAILAVYGTTIIKVFGTQDNNNNIINSLLTDDKQLSAKGSVSSSSLPFIPSQTIAIPNVNGRIDHMAVDIADQRLFVAELGNNSLDVIDLKSAKRILSIGNNKKLLNEPQSVLFIPELNRIFVSNGQDDTVDVFDAKSFILIKKIKLPSDDADNMRYDANRTLVYVGYGEGY